MVTSTALIARLKEVYETDGQEELARKLNVPLRNLQRWSSGKGIKFEEAVDLLERAGWLNLDERTSLSRAKQERARRSAQALSDQLQELVSLLR